MNAQITAQAGGVNVNVAALPVPNGPLVAVPAPVARPVAPAPAPAPVARPAAPAPAPAAPAQGRQAAGNRRNRTNRRPHHYDPVRYENGREEELRRAGCPSAPLERKIQKMLRKSKQTKNGNRNWALGRCM